MSDDFLATIMRYPNLTIFAPTNAAWNEEGVKDIRQDKKRLREIMDLHVVKELLPLDVIKHKQFSNTVGSKGFENVI